MDYKKEIKDLRNINFLKKINLYLITVFIFSVITMRGVMNITSAILLLNSFFIFFLEKKFKYKNIWTLFLLSYPLVVFLNLFSPAGLKGGLNTAGRFYYVIIFFIFIVNNLEYKNKKYFIYAFEFGMIIASIWSLYLFFTKSLDIHYLGNHNGYYRLRSFESVGRWGIYLMIALILKYSDLFIDKNKWKQLYNFSYFILLIYLMFLNGGRGIWLCTAIGLFIFTIMSFNIKVYAMATFLIFITLIGLNHKKMDYYRYRIKSIINLKSDASNNIRFETWKVALDTANKHPFFGVGYDRKQKYTLEYREKMKEYKNEEYIKKYLGCSWVIEGSYMAILAQNGYIYIFYYLSLIVYLVFKIGKGILKFKNKIRFEMLGLFSATLSYFILQQFYLDLQNYSIYLPYLFLFLMYDKINNLERKSDEYLV